MIGVTSICSLNMSPLSVLTNTKMNQNKIFYSFGGLWEYVTQVFPGSSPWYYDPHLDRSPPLVNIQNVDENNESSTPLNRDTRQQETTEGFAKKHRGGKPEKSNPKSTCRDQRVPKPQLSPLLECEHVSISTLSQCAGKYILVQVLGKRYQLISLLDDFNACAHPADLEKPVKRFKFKKFQEFKNYLKEHKIQFEDSDRPFKKTKIGKKILFFKGSIRFSCDDCNLAPHFPWKCPKICQQCSRSNKFVKHDGICPHVKLLNEQLSDDVDLPPSDPVPGNKKPNNPPLSLRMVTITYRTKTRYRLLGKLKPHLVYKDLYDLCLDCGALSSSKSSSYSRVTFVNKVFKHPTFVHWVKNTPHGKKLIKDTYRIYYHFSIISGSEYHVTRRHDYDFDQSHRVGPTLNKPTPSYNWWQRFVSYFFSRDRGSFWHTDSIKRNYYAALIQTYPTFSLYLEEYLKCLPGFTWLIATSEYYRFGKKNYNFHMSIRNLSLSQRIALHKRFNSRKKISEQEDFEGTHYIKDIEHCGELQHWRRGVTIVTLPQPKFTPAQTQVHYFHNDEEPRTGQLFPILFGITSMRRPDNSLANMQASLWYRVLFPKWALVPCDGLICDQYYNTVTIPRARKKLLEIANCIFFETKKKNYDQWFNSLLPRQQRLIKQDFSNEEKYGKKPTSVKFSLKLDELLSTYQKFIPRNLFNLSGYYHGKVGLAVAEITEALKEGIFSPEATQVFFTTKCFSFYFTCGATSATICSFLNKSLQDPTRHYFVIMGDDSFCCYNGNFYECDYSGFDRSQNDFLRNLVHIVYKNNGYSKMVDYIDEYYSLPISVVHKYKDVHTILANPHTMQNLQMRYTGETTTCLSNSILNIICSMYAYSFKDDDMARHYAECGLVAKFKEAYDTYFKGTYLKGAIFLIDDELKWMRLPSFLCKFGKTLTNPLVTQKPLPFDMRYEQALYGQWLGYGNMSVNWFYIEISKQIERLCEGCIKQPQQLQEWQVVSTCDWYLNDHIFNSWMFERYGIDKGEMLDFIHVLSQVVVLPATYKHSVLDKLELVDY